MLYEGDCSADEEVLNTNMDMDVDMDVDVEVRGGEGRDGRERAEPRERSASSTTVQIPAQPETHDAPEHFLDKYLRSIPTDTCTADPLSTAKYRLVIDTESLLNAHVLSRPTLKSVIPISHEDRSREKEEEWGNGPSSSSQADVDTGGGTGERRRADVRMIDFAHTIVPVDPCVDDSYIYGLHSLITKIENVLLIVDGAEDGR